MRRFVLALAAVVTIAGAGSLISANRADAMTLNGSSLGAALQENSATEQVAYVCRRFWNGYYWVRRCYHTAPRYYAPRRYYRPYHRPHRYYRYY